MSGKSGRLVVIVHIDPITGLVLTELVTRRSVNLTVLQGQATIGRTAIHDALRMLASNKFDACVFISASEPAALEMLIKRTPLEMAPPPCAIYMTSIPAFLSMFLKEEAASAVVLSESWIDKRIPIRDGPIGVRASQALLKVASERLSVFSGFDASISAELKDERTISSAFVGLVIEDGKLPVPLTRSENGQLQPDGDGGLLYTALVDAIYASAGDSITTRWWGDQMPNDERLALYTRNIIIPLTVHLGRTSGVTLTPKEDIKTTTSSPVDIKRLQTVTSEFDSATRKMELAMFNASVDEGLDLAKFPGDARESAKRLLMTSPELLINDTVVRLPATDDDYRKLHQRGLFTVRDVIMAILSRGKSPSKQTKTMRRLAGGLSPTMFDVMRVLVYGGPRLIGLYGYNRLTSSYLVSHGMISRYTPMADAALVAKSVFGQTLSFR